MGHRTAVAAYSQHRLAPPKNRQGGFLQLDWRSYKVASAAVHRVEQAMQAQSDASEQDQLRRLRTACIASLTEPPAPAT